MYFDNMFDPRRQPPRATPLRPSPPKPPKPPKQQRAPQKPKPERKPERQRKCPSGFRWDSKRGRCVQAGVGPEFKP